MQDHGADHNPFAGAPAPAPVAKSDGRPAGGAAPAQPASARVLDPAAIAAALRPGVRPLSMAPSSSDAASLASLSAARAQAGSGAPAAGPSKNPFGPSSSPPSGPGPAASSGAAGVAGNGNGGYGMAGGSASSHSTVRLNAAPVAVTPYQHAPPYGPACQAPLTAESVIDEWPRTFLGLPPLSLSGSSVKSGGAGATAADGNPAGPSASPAVLYGSAVSGVRGERVIFSPFDCNMRVGPARVPGTVAATTYQLVFTPKAWTNTVAAHVASGAAAAGVAAHVPMPYPLSHLPRSYFLMPIGLIRRLERTSHSGSASAVHLIDITAKDASRCWTLEFPSDSTLDQVLRSLRATAFPSKPEFLPAFDGPTPAAADGSSGSSGLAPATPASAGSPFKGWDDVFNPFTELQRLGVLSVVHPLTGRPLWRVSDLNHEYGYCPTYPSVLVFPERATDDQMQAVAAFRSRARVPALTWMHPGNKATLWRSAQPKVGLNNNSCKADELLITYIRDANVYNTVRAYPGAASGGVGGALGARPLPPVLIADCRPKANAVANKAAGWGYETYPSCAVLEFLNIANIHAIRDASKRLEGMANAPNYNLPATLGGAHTGALSALASVTAANAAAAAAAASNSGGPTSPGGSAAGASPSSAAPAAPAHDHYLFGSTAPALAHALDREVNWEHHLDESDWLFHVRTVLAGGLSVAEALHRRGQSVLVHCSDGWDRTAQVCGLAQIFLDPYARTLRGFCSLIAKEWCSFGHKFHDRAGHGNAKHDDSDASPVFVQWLDAVSHLVRMWPSVFQFNARTLVVIGHHLYSCRFGNFLFNCERERRAADVAGRTQSLWAWMLHPSRIGLFLNPGYDPEAGDVFLPSPQAVLRGVSVWGDWWLRWSPGPSLPSTCAKMERYTDSVYDRAVLHAAQALGAGVCGSSAKAIEVAVAAPVTATTTAGAADVAPAATAVAKGSAPVADDSAAAASDAAAAASSACETTELELSMELDATTAAAADDAAVADEVGEEEGAAERARKRVSTGSVPASPLPEESSAEAGVAAGPAEEDEASLPLPPAAAAEAEPAASSKPAAPLFVVGGEGDEEDDE